MGKPQREARNSARKTPAFQQASILFATTMNIVRERGLPEVENEILERIFPNVGRILTVDEQGEYWLNPFVELILLEVSRIADSITLSPDQKLYEISRIICLGGF